MALTIAVMRSVDFAVGLWGLSLVLAPLCISHIKLSTFLNLYKPHFLLLQNENNISAYYNCMSFPLFKYRDNRGGK